MKIAHNELHQIKQVYLPRIIEDYGISLKENGSQSFQCLCPFHEDKNPSLHVNKKNGQWLWHCFGCHKSGNVLDFVIQYERIDFISAYAKLRNQMSDARCEIKEANEGPKQRSASNINYQELLERVIDFYHESLFEDKRGIEYLAQRGLKDDTIYQSFKIGFANGSLKNILPTVSRLKPREGEDHELVKGLQETGILNQRGNEHFYHCVIFPIFDEDGNITEIYGRRITSANSLNSSNSPTHLYLPGPHKGVWNWPCLKTSPEIVFTEGIIDALSLYILGFRNVIPLYGVHGLTEDHLRLFTKYRTEKVYLCFDNDGAGKEARERVKEKIAHLPIEVFNLELPEEYHDLNDGLQKGLSYSGFNQLKNAGQGKTISQKPVLSAVEGDNIIDTPEGTGEYPKVTKQEDTIFLDFGQRLYRVRGLTTRNLERMRVNLKLQDKQNYHLDSLDLYSSKSRSIFIKQGRKLLYAEEKELSGELNQIIQELEKLQANSLEIKTETEERKITKEEEQEAVATLKSPSLLEDILKDLEILGYVGEESNKALGYLVTISRKLEEPLSCVIISQSSAGKSALAESLEKLVPPEECLLYSRVTPQALYYMDKDALKRKVLMIEERTGGESADYSIRTLQTRKKLTQAVPIKDPNTGRIRTVSFEVEGPIAYLETTTRPRINQENATRCFELYLDESKEQTKRIQQAQKESKRLNILNKQKEKEKLIQKHQNIQRLLNQIRVVNPYAHLLEFPTEWLRTRRDHLRFLNLIEVITFLYQYQRETKKTADNQQYIESTLEDYRTAYNLAREVLGESFTELKKPQRELLNQIETLMEQKNKESVNRRQIREYTGLPDHRLRELLQELVSLEYLLVQEGRQGKSYCYQLAARANALDKILMGLTTPEELEKKLKRNEKSDKS
ncbi:MAG: toprim domain-containing protein [Nitrospinae bacterium]|nr:toprim domain-containing protein [Nitrospinota bacterium]